MSTYIRHAKHASKTAIAEHLFITRLPTHTRARHAGHAKTAQRRRALRGVTLSAALRDIELESAEEGFSTVPLCFDTITSALEEVARGNFVVVLDDEHRENEGDLIAAADRVTTESLAFMVRHTSGVICVGMQGEDLDRLALPLMVPPEHNSEAKCTAFTITVDLKHGITTGISAEDRAKTIRALTHVSTRAEDLRRPGHIFPLRYEPGGVLKRRGHTEASVDLARLAGCHPSGILCELVNQEDGSMQRTPQLFKFARIHGLKIITIEALVKYLRQNSHLC